jgi:hypothetical protein
MKTGICVWVALAAAMTAAPEPRPVEIARAMMQAMGGQTAWNQARYVRFDFTLKIRGHVTVSRAHLWDKQTGRYRLEEKPAEGKFAVVLFNTRDQHGAAYMNGTKLEGPDAAADVKGAYRAFRTEIDWLALPWNWLAPGVHLKYAGEKSLNGQAFDVVEVTVEEPDAPEGVRYNAYVSRLSHLMEHCSVGADTSLWDWQYTTTGGIQLASDHTNTERRVSISMGNVQVLDKVDDVFFADPARKLATLK